MSCPDLFALRDEPLTATDRAHLQQCAACRALVAMTATPEATASDDCDELAPLLALVGTAELAPEDTARVDHHLADCAHCRAATLLPPSGEPANQSEQPTGAELTPLRARRSAIALGATLVAAAAAVLLWLARTPSSEHGKPPHDHSGPRPAAARPLAPPTAAPGHPPEVNLTASARVVAVDPAGASCPTGSTTAVLIPVATVTFEIEQVIGNLSYDLTMPRRVQVRETCPTTPNYQEPTLPVVGQTYQLSFYALTDVTERSLSAHGGNRFADNVFNGTYTMETEPGVPPRHWAVRATPADPVVARSAFSAIARVESVDPEGATCSSRAGNGSTRVTPTVTYAIEQPAVEGNIPWRLTVSYPCPHQLRGLGRVQPPLPHVGDRHRLEGRQLDPGTDRWPGDAWVAGVDHIRGEPAVLFRGYDKQVAAVLAMPVNPKGASAAFSALARVESVNPAGPSCGRREPGRSFTRTSAVTYAVIPNSLEGSAPARLTVTFPCPSELRDIKLAPQPLPQVGVVHRLHGRQLEPGTDRWPGDLWVAGNYDLGGELAVLYRGYYTDRGPAGEPMRTAVMAMPSDELTATHIPGVAELRLRAELDKIEIDGKVSAHRVEVYLKVSNTGTESITFPTPARLSATVTGLQGTVPATTEQLHGGPEPTVGLVTLLPGESTELRVDQPNVGVPGLEQRQILLAIGDDNWLLEPGSYRVEAAWANPPRPNGSADYWTTSATLPPLILNVTEELELRP